MMFLMVSGTGLNLCIPLLSREIMDKGFIGGDFALLTTCVGIQTLLLAAESLLNVVNEKNRIMISIGLDYTLSEHAFNHLLRSKSSELGKRNQAELLNVIQEDIANIVSIANKGMIFAVSQIFSILGGMVGLFYISWQLALVVILYVPFRYMFMKLFAQKQKTCMESFIQTSQEYARWFGDTVGGVEEIKLFQAESFKQKEFEKRKKKVLESKGTMNIIGQWNGVADTMMLQFLLMALYVFGANMVFGNYLSVGSVFAFITYSSYVTSPISSILNIGYMLSGVIPSTKRFFAFLNTKEEEDFGKGKAYMGDLVFNRVSFSYEKNNPVLRNISMRFPVGTKTAIIGRNGSGKSTIIKLIARMYQPQEGRILLDKKDITGLSLESYRTIFAIVSQDIYLFDDTIRNNICFYREVEEERLLQAVKDSGLYDFVKKVSLDYRVGCNGCLLSGGQRQKVALARALVHDRPILLFDEAESNVDADSKIHLEELLQTGLQGKTVIVVTHNQNLRNIVNYVISLDERE